MPRQTNLSALMCRFALSLHPHACVLLAPCRESVFFCVYVVCVRIAILLQICAITRFTVEFGAKNGEPTLCDAWYSSNHMCADIACHGLCVYSNLVLFFRGIITQQTLLKHSFRTAICDFMGSNQVFSPQSVLQRLFFVHCQQFLVDKAGSKQTQQDG